MIYLITSNISTRMLIYRKNKYGVSQKRVLTNNTKQDWRKLNTSLSTIITNFIENIAFDVQKLDCGINEILTIQDLEKHYPELLL